MSEATLPRQAVIEAVADLFKRMMKSYSAEPTRRITSMDIDAVFMHVEKLGIGGCLDEADEILAGVKDLAPTIVYGALPELPPPARYAPNGREPENFTEQQMQEYARAAIAAAGPNAALVEALRGMLGVWNMLCDANGWERDHMQQQKDAISALAAAGVKEPS